MKFLATESWQLRKVKKLDMYQIKTNSFPAQKMQQGWKEETEKDTSSKYQYLNIVFRGYFFASTLNIPFD